MVKFSYHEPAAAAGGISRAMARRSSTDRRGVIFFNGACNMPKGLLLQRIYFSGGAVKHF
jgi:hypothetical protein